MAGKRLVLQAVAGDCPTIDVSAPYALAYALRMGADYTLRREENHTGTPGMPKPHFVKRCIDHYCKYYDQVLWLDADVIARPSAPDIFAETPKGYFGAWCGEGEINQDSVPPHPMYPHGYFNSGVMVCPRAFAGMMGRAERLYVGRASLMTQGERDRLLWDQTPLNKAVAMAGLPVHKLDIRWNHHQSPGRCKKHGFPPIKDAYFPHFAGGHNLPQDKSKTLAERMDQGVRAQQMREWIAENMKEESL
jgi:lipopolysaccharide biosynthesis glycosyltransferase